jgi:NTP pyrophosphatase (non-canonical NTP hydrolase)
MPENTAAAGYGELIKAPADPVAGAGPYSIGSQHWPGLAKMAEEAGELVQVAMKLIAAGGGSEHWDGSDVLTRLQDEIADVLAAIDFFTETNGVPIPERFIERRRQKLDLFRRWHLNYTDGSLNRDAS